MKLYCYLVLLAFVSLVVHPAAGSPIYRSGAPGDSIRVLVFLSESCPICQQMTPNLKTVIDKYQGMRFDFIFPNYTVSDSQSIRTYLAKYQLKGDFIIDKQQELTHKYAATHTPEIILIKDTDVIIYRGKLDNQYERLGQRRRIITAHYLADALESVYSGQEIKIKNTDPVGCFIIKP